MIDYKINEKYTYTIHRKDHKGKTYYNIVVSKKNADGTIVFGNKTVRLPAGVDLPDGTKIKILKAFEDFYKKDNFLTVFTLTITDFEVVEEAEPKEEFLKIENNDEIFPF